MKRIIYTLIYIVFTVLILVQCKSQRDRIDKENNTHEIIDTYEVENYEQLEFALEECYSITLKNDIETAKDLILEGSFSKTCTATENNIVIDVGRKLNLSSADRETNINRDYKLISPKLIIRSKNSTITGGKYIGDLYVEEEGLTLDNIYIDGNVIFKNSKVRESFQDKNNTIVSGEIIIK